MVPAVYEQDNYMESDEMISSDGGAAWKPVTRRCEDVPTVRRWDFLAKVSCNPSRYIQDLTDLAENGATPMAPG